MPRPWLRLLAVGVLAQGAGALTLQTPVRIDLPAWAGPGSCAIETADRSAGSGRQVDGTLTLECPSRGVAKCDVAGAEPLDISLEDACRRRVLPLRQGRPLDIDVAHPSSPVTIEWLDGSAQPPLTVIATRVAGTSPVWVAVDHPDRLIRFTRSGASPHTVRAGDLAGSAPWMLPPARPGGEVIGYQPAAEVRPLRYRLDPLGELVELRGNWVIVSGLPSGECQITPVYRGNVDGAPTIIRVAEGRSALVQLPTQPVGAVRVQMTEALCADVREILVDRLDRPRNAKFRASAIQTEGACDLSIEGLAPGQYEVTAASPDGVRQLLTADVAEQDVVPLWLDAPVVRVFGTISLAGKPPPAATRIAFEPVAALGKGRAASVAVQADGSFTARLSDTGQYRVRLQTGPVLLLGTERAFVARDGYNSFEWSIDGGTVTINVGNWDRSSRLVLQLSLVPTLDSIKSHVAVGTDAIIEPDQNLPLTLAGLAFMDYIVEAVQRLPTGVYRRSRPARFSLSSSAPTQDVTLDLREYDAHLALRGSDDTPIFGAAVSTREGRAVETEPGVYRLTARQASPGVPVAIRASGFVPVCRSAPASGATTTVRLAAGRAATVEFTGRDDVAFPPGELVWEGSECFVSLRDFDFSLSTTRPDATTFVIRNWPIAGAVTYRISELYPAFVLTAGPDGSFRIALPGK